MTPVTQQTQLDEYRTALCPGSVTPDPGLADLIIRAGLGPFWHEQTGADVFKSGRMAAAAQYAGQRAALGEIHAALDAADINFVVFKGAANRELLYRDPAVRECADIDLLVSRADRHRAIEALGAIGFVPYPDAASISRELVLSRDVVDIDLHWGILREGRLRREPTEDFLARRRLVDGLWMPSADDTAFLLLIHPAFAKHISGTGMALHRVWDIVSWWRTQPVDANALNAMLTEQGVRTAAWAVLEWAKMLVPEFSVDTVAWQPGAIRRGWLRAWLRYDWSARTASWHAIRLLAFTSLLHDTPADAWRAWRGYWKSRRERQADMEAFS